MHELSIAATIMESVLEFATVRRIAKVTQVRLAIGELTCVQAEQLQFCYQSITSDPVLQGSALEIEIVPARIKCPECSYEGSPRYWMDSLADTPVPTLQCPECGKTAELAQGHECAIKTIQYVG